MTLSVFFFKLFGSSLVVAVTFGILIGGGALEAPKPLQWLFVAALFGSVIFGIFGAISYIWGI